MGMGVTYKIRQPPPLPFQPRHIHWSILDLNIKCVENLNYLINIRSLNSKLSLQGMTMTGYQRNIWNLNFWKRWRSMSDSNTKYLTHLNFLWDLSVATTAWKCRANKLFLKKKEQRRYSIHSFLVHNCKSHLF